MMTRSTAVKIGIKDINEAEFVRSTERWEPNYLVTPFKDRVSRVRVLATVVSKFVSEDKKYSTVTLDDGSDTISVRVFEEDGWMLKGLAVGDIVDVVGKIKEYREERYISPESIWRIDDPNWELVRKLELLLATKTRSIHGEENDTLKKDIKIEGASPAIAKASESAPEVDTIEVVKEVIESKPRRESKDKPSKEKKDSVKEDSDQKSMILNLIKNMDEGEGVKYITLLKESKLTEEALEAVLNELMQDGDIYEPKIGRFKGV
jgi:hypothetical protein